MNDKSMKAGVKSGLSSRKPAPKAHRANRPAKLEPVTQEKPGKAKAPR